MKKFLSLSLALILCVALSVPAFAANYTSYTWSDEYTTMKFDAAAVATETIKAWDYDSEEYTNQNVTMITVKPGSSVTVTGDSMFTLSELTEDGYGEDYMGAEIKTGAVDDIFTNFPAGALFVVEYGKTYIKLGGVDEQPTAPAQPTAPTQPAAPAQPAAPTQPAAPAAAGTYTVKKGDTYGTIALNNYGTYGVWSELYKANKGVKLTEGATLVLPEKLGKVARINAPAAASGETLYTVKAGDTLGAIAKVTYGDVMKYKTIFERNADRLVNANTIHEATVIILPST